ncbi:J domain-containing protein [Yokenella regensburgei]|uniref:J domain-containing protein n=1 Tax=Yokenella regensburgei TaxID=158877 RepID=UPI001432C62B|nr:DnaJ domain-containing protein [Yokenella regensburgei]QIU92542.1 DnaJ domain-containing protein [Yokenella regensburgei]
MKLLNIEQHEVTTITSSMVNSAYRKMAAKIHPDKNQGQEAAAAAKFIELGNAKEELLKLLKAQP